MSSRYTLTRPVVVSFFEILPLHLSSLVPFVHLCIFGQGTFARSLCGGLGLFTITLHITCSRYHPMIFTTQAFCAWLCSEPL
ncbi:hypothetical protein C8R48DRAFT_694479 [Suillus tomentosus]|nr:hypothetical protein C8R48DRAFT_694479 [Suillus tomentosus]